MYLFNKKLIFNKLLLDCSKYFLIIIFSFGIIVWTIQAVNFLDFVTEDGHGMTVYLKYTLLNFPKIFAELFTLMFFISLIYTLNKYEENNELKILWLNGISKNELINQILKYSLIITFILLILKIFVVPYSSNKARTYLQFSNVDFFPSLIKEKQFIDTVSDLTLFIEDKDQNIFKNIFLKETSIQNEKIIYAKEGWLMIDGKNKEFKLLDGKIINISDKNYSEISFDKTSYDLSKYLTKSIVDFKIQEKSTYLISSCFWNYYIKNRLEYFDVYNCNDQALEKIISEIYKRIFKPIFIIVLTLIVCFLIYIPKEDSYFKNHKIFIYLSSFLIIILSELLDAIIGKNYYNFISIFLLPFLLFALIYIYTVIRRSN